MEQPSAKFYFGELFHDIADMFPLFLLPLCATTVAPANQLRVLLYKLQTINFDGDRIEESIAGRLF